MVSASAPQMPYFAFGVMRQGPMWHRRQQTPSVANLHCGCWLLKRSQTVGMLSQPARVTIWLMAGSRETCFTAGMSEMVDMKSFPC